MPRAVRSAQSLSGPAIARLRQQVTHFYRIRTENQALGFIRDLGFCYAFTQGAGNLPYLFEVLATRSDDRRWSWAWDWKEALPSEKRVFYGRVLGRKPTFISMEFLPSFFALTGNVGEPDDYRRLYDAGRLSHLARVVYELVAARGPLTTRQIRAAVEPNRRGSSASLLRALADLQAVFLVARTGETGDNPGNYAYVWDLFARWLPGMVARAAKVSHRTAASTVLERYVAIVGAPRPEDAAALFEWPPSILTAAVEDLLGRGAIAVAQGPEGEDRLLATQRLTRGAGRAPTASS